MTAFAEAIERAHQTRSLLALILTGGGQAFVSGGDLSELQHYPSREDGLRLATIMGDALARLEALPIPTIAAINGPARGGGAEIAMACDLRVMADDADIGFVHTRLGIVTAWGGGQRLLRAAGYARAMELMMTGRVVLAKEALALGIANALSPAGRALETALNLCQQFVSNPPAAIQAVKRILQNGLNQTFEMALQAERHELPPLWDTEYRREAMSRFLNKSHNSNGRGQKI
jgi:enoyl-CoA hydratase